MKLRVLLLVPALGAVLAARGAGAQGRSDPSWASGSAPMIAFPGLATTVRTGPLIGQRGTEPQRAALRVEARSRDWATPLGHLSLYGAAVRASDGAGVAASAFDAMVLSQWRDAGARTLSSAIGWRALDRGLGVGRVDLEAAVPLGSRLRLSVGLEHLVRHVQASTRPVTVVDSGAIPLDSGAVPANPWSGGTRGDIPAWSFLRLGLEGSSHGVNWRLAGWSTVARPTLVRPDSLRLGARRSGFSVDFDRALSPRIAAEASIGSHGWSSVGQGFGVSLGFRIRAPMRRVPKFATVDSLDMRAPVGNDGMLHLRVRATGATSVEVLSDLTAWRVVRLQSEAGTGWWSLAVEPIAGLHRISVRIDGGTWSPPPGLPVEADEYGGQAGVLRLP